MRKPTYSRIGVPILAAASSSWFVVLSSVVLAGVVSSFVAVSVVQQNEIRELQDAPPVEGGNQTALDLLQDQIDVQSMQIETLEMAAENAAEMIADIFFLIAGKMWTSELKEPPFTPPTPDLIFRTDGLPPDGGDNRGNWRVSDFYGAAPMWNVSTTVPLVTLDVINAPNYVGNALQANGIFLENGTYSISIEIDGTCDHPTGRSACRHDRWFTVIPLSAMTTLDGLDATVDFGGNAIVQDDWTTTYFWSQRVAGITTSSAISAANTPATVPITPVMSNGILNIPDEGAHVHMVHFLPYLNYWSQTYTTFKINIAKFETAQ